MLQTTYSMPMGRRLASLSRGSISSRFPPAAYTTNLSSSSIRPASSSSGSSAEERTHVFVFWAPDYTDKDAPVRRLAVRETHLHETKPGQETGYYCGLFVTTSYHKLTLTQYSVVPSLPLALDAPKKMAGSLLLVRAKSIEEVRTNIEADIYWKSGVVSLCESSPTSN